MRLSEKAYPSEDLQTTGCFSRVLPAVFVTDGGSEYMSEQISQITELGITIIKESPYRAD